MGEEVDGVRTRLETCLRFVQLPDTAEIVHRELKALVPEVLQAAERVLNLVEIAERRAGEYSVELSKLRKLLELLQGTSLDASMEAIFRDAGSDPKSWDEGFAESAAQLDSPAASRDSFWLKFVLLFLDKKVFNKLVAMNDDSARNAVERLIQARLADVEEQDMRPLWSDILLEFSCPEAFLRTSPVLPAGFFDDPQTHEELAKRIAAYIATVRPGLVRERLLTGGSQWPDIAPHVVMLLAGKQASSPLSAGEEATLSNLLSIVAHYRKIFASNIDEIAQALQVSIEHWVFRGHVTNFMLRSGALEKGNQTQRILCELSFLVSRMESAGVSGSVQRIEKRATDSSIELLQSSRVQRMPTPVDFAILAALPEEFDALRGYISDLRQLEKDGSSSFTFYTGTIATKRADGDVYSVVLGMAQHQGPEEAGLLANALLRRWSPKHVILVGIAGGIHDVTDLGDIVIARAISDSTWGRIEDSGRTTRWRQLQTDRELFDATHHYRETPWQKVAPQRPDSGVPKCRHGVIVSGGDLVVSKKTVLEYKKELSDPIAVEMEGGAIATACHNDPSHPGFIVLKAVSDHCDRPARNKRDKGRWRQYAAHISAAYCVELLRSGPVPAIAHPPASDDEDVGLDVNRVIGELHDSVAAVRIAAMDSVMEFVLAKGSIPDDVRPELERMALNRSLSLRERARAIEILRQQGIASALLKRLIDEWIGGVDDTIGHVIQGAVTDDVEALNFLCERLDAPGSIPPTAARDALIAIRYHLLNHARELGGNRARRCLEVAQRFKNVPECTVLLNEIQRMVEGDVTRVD